MGRSIVILLSIFPLFGSAQIIFNLNGNLARGENYFNEQFIEINNVRSITGKLSIKKDLQPITETGEIVQYDFNEKGKLDSYVKTFINYRRKVDTSSILYKYNDIYNLVSVTTDYGTGFERYDYNYNEKGNKINETYYRGKNLSNIKYEFKEGKEFLVKSESFEYEEISESSFKKVYFNSEGKPYKESTFIYDELDNLKEENTKYTLTNRREQSTVSYDEEGKLLSFKRFSNLITPVEHLYTYSYDEYGNLFEELYSKDGKLMTTRQFLYQTESLLLKAELIKNESNGDIKIIRYNYEFYSTETDSTVNN